jgi:hypothetical protein
MSSKIDRIQRGQNLGGHMKSQSLLSLSGWLLAVLAVPLTAAAQDTQQRTIPPTSTASPTSGRWRAERLANHSLLTDMV